MNTLFDLDAIPVVEPTAPKKPVQHYRYYLIRKYSGDWYFLWKTHTNGGCEWGHDYELTINGGKKKPLLYKTLSGASRMLLAYTRAPIEGGVAVWDEIK